MRYSQEYCIHLPEDFPHDELVRFMAHARAVLLQPVKSPQWTEFAGASNLIAWRYRSAFECWEAYKTSLASAPQGDHEELYRRERELFGMFTAGVSCIESASYSLAALSSHPSLLGIPFDLPQQRQCSPSALRGWIAPYPSASALATSLDAILTAPEWRLWVDLRNRMSHRSNIPRVVRASIGSPLPAGKPLHFGPTSSTAPVEAEIVEFDALRDWLSNALRELLEAGATLR
jgi:hypothetical protein